MPVSQPAEIVLPAQTTEIFANVYQTSQPSSYPTSYPTSRPTNTQTSEPTVGTSAEFVPIITATTLETAFPTAKCTLPNGQPAMDANGLPYPETFCPTASLLSGATVVAAAR